jgi:hypothetical protein
MMINYSADDLLVRDWRMKSIEPKVGLAAILRLMVLLSVSIANTTVGMSPDLASKAA